MKLSKRYMITYLAAIFFALLAILSIFKGMETAASSSIAGILTTLSTYIWGETKRPSNTDNK